MCKFSKSYFHITMMCLFLWLAAIQASAQPTAFSGRATGITAHVRVPPVAAVTTRVSDTGALSSSGGSLQESAVSADLLLGAV